MMNDFKNIQECPTVFPEEWQFDNPIEYLSSKEMVELGNKYGVIKVVPPPNWRPPFLISQNFKFHTRLQRLSDLGIVARSRKFFHDNLNLFLKMKQERGLRRYSFKLEHVEIFYYDLYKEVELIKPMNDSKWGKVAIKFGYHGLLKPLKFEYTTHIEEYAKYLEDYEKYDFPDIGVEQEDCVVCGDNDDPTRTLLCDNCDNAYHMACLIKPLDQIPQGKWYCDKCLVGTGEYGFEEQHDIKYTLPEFHQICSEFEREFMSEYPGQPKTIDFVERKFWELIESQDLDLEVQYGADIHNQQIGEISAFPMDGSYYLNHPFNLTNLPFARGSLLNYIKTLISGMTVPWIYIGSLLLTFCWHVEDHHTLSANYCHFGATKKWYGIPLDYADKFETLMKTKAPDLFKKQPDLLHQLVTLMSPTEILDNGIPCYFANQNPGEFVITYPRVYHSGFNSGFNFNEAVNFTTEDWLGYGGKSVNSYKAIAKENVFDHHVLLSNILDTFTKNGAGEFSLLFIRLCLLEFNAFIASQQLRLSLLPFAVERVTDVYEDDDEEDEESLCGLCKTYMSHQYCSIDNKCHNFLSKIGQLGAQKKTHLLTPGASPLVVQHPVSRITRSDTMTAASAKIAQLQPTAKQMKLDISSLLSPMDEDLQPHTNVTVVKQEGRIAVADLLQTLQEAPEILRRTGAHPNSQGDTPPGTPTQLAQNMVNQYERLINEAKKHALQEKEPERRHSKRIKKVAPLAPTIPRDTVSKGTGIFRLLNEKDLIKLCLECVHKHRIGGSGIVIKCQNTIQEMQKFSLLVDQKVR